jgi:uncharacterized protein (UPF0248 family)
MKDVNPIAIQVTLMDGREMSTVSVADTVEEWLKIVKHVGHFTYVNTIGESWYIPYHAVATVRKKA